MPTWGPRRSWAARRFLSQIGSVRNIELSSRLALEITAQFLGLLLVRQLQPGAGSSQLRRFLNMASPPCYQVLLTGVVPVAVFSCWVWEISLFFLRQKIFFVE